MFKPIILIFDKFKKHLILFLLLLLNIVAHAQFHNICAVPPSDYVTDSLRNIYGNNKIFIDDIEKAALVALSYYPDLVNVNIEFRLNKIKTTMAARPKYCKILRSGTKRKYLISINKRDNCMGIVFFNNLPFDAQVGVIAHELYHISDYVHRSFFGIAGFGINYLTSKGRKKTENRTDEAVIKHGLGNALSKYCYCLEHDSCLPKEYIEYKKKYYYTYNDIIELTKKWEDSRLTN